MPDRGGIRGLHRLCDSVSGVNWRPTRFDDELTLSRYSCCVCRVIPSTTVVLPCSHALCELCVTGCVVQDGGSICPLDAQPFCEDECQKLKLPAKTKNNLKAHCWNDAHGCKFVGTIEAVLLHFDRECAFHAVQCPRCERRILRTDIAAHCVAGCPQSASCASSARPNRQDSRPTSCYESAILEKLSALQTQMSGLSRTWDSARLNVISGAVSAFESSCLRGLKGIESNIISTMTQQLTAGLEEVKILVRDPLSDQLSSVQSQVNELVEQSRQHDASEMQEVV
ncbi:TNF receptor-associated factor 6-like [Rhipicephalus sanguineus]|uniref:TNF receptor-associated factor 6-like n=1 Tax=Rhipicephalus sanguineus TaxID=34632 RepID=UPI0018962A29|nr:TNF receptor-associated factor 6-like [Rhipicephalus sanguineus]